MRTITRIDGSPDDAQRKIIIWCPLLLKELTDRPALGTRLRILHSSLARCHGVVHSTCILKPMAGQEGHLCLLSSLAPEDDVAPTWWGSELYFGRCHLVFILAHSGNLFFLSLDMSTGNQLLIK